MILFSKIISLGLFGMEAYKVIVEADISGGMPRFDIVGLLLYQKAKNEFVLLLKTQICNILSAESQSTLRLLI